MSKIAEKKALEAYPILFSERNGYDNTFKDRRESYVKGYNQAMQDFLEKAEEFLYLQLNNGSIECGNIERLIEQFKNYMQNEM